MSITAAELIGLVAIRGADEAVLKLAAVGKSADTAGEKLGLLATGAVVVAGAGLVAFGVHAVQVAADFQQSMTLLTTSAGESQNNLKMVGAGILKMSVDTATGTDKLSAAMFTVESAGYHGAAGLAVLKAAAEGAKIENANLEKVTDALTTTMHDWREPANQAIDVMNSFREAASIGKMRMDDFVGAMKNVGPIASLAKIPLTDVEAALSTMSLEGDKGAAAGTHLAQSLLNMIAPSTKAKDVLKEIGLTAQQVSDGMQKSLPDTLKMITDAIGKKFPEGSQKYNEAMSAMFGGTRGLKAILELTGANLKDFTKDAADLAPIMKQNASNVDGWALVQQNFNFKIDQAKDALNALFIKAGTQLLPILNKLFDAVTPLITQFGDWIDKNNVLTNAFNTTVSIIQNSINFYNQWKGVIQNTALALTVFFIPAIIKAGIEAVVSAAKITYNFVASLILTGAQGWAAAGKLAIYIAALIATGTQAVINAAKITFSFIASLIATGVQAYVAAYAVSGSFVPALGMVGMQALAAAGKLLVGLIPALYATGVAFYAALGPIGLVLGAVALAIAAFAAMKHQSDIMSLGVSGAFDTMGNKVQRSTGRIMATADQMKNGVSNSANTMKNNVDSSFTTMQNQSISDVRMLTSEAISMFANMGDQVGIDMANMSQDAIGYWNNVAGYIANHPITATVHYTQGMGAPLMHNAEGTNFSPGGMSWVGERGPEIMYIPRGAQIIPNNQIGSMTPSGSSASSGQPVQININIAGHRVGQVLLPDIVQAIRTHTGAKF